MGTERSQHGGYWTSRAPAPLSKIGQGFAILSFLVAKHPPNTAVGDVLILMTTATYVIFAVGSVLTPGQHDFGHQQEDDVQHVTTRALAEAVAHALVAPKGRIFLFDIDTADWSQIA